MIDWFFKSLSFYPSGNWQAGQDPNNFVKTILSRNQVPISHKARQITVEDYKSFDYILGMDNYNIMELNRCASALQSDSQIILLGSFYHNKSEQIICDPFFDNKQEDFEKCFKQISSSCANFLKYLVTNEAK